MSIAEDIVWGMARTLWLVAFADYVETSKDSRFVRARGGQNWDDVAPETPEAVVNAAQELANLYTLANGVSLEALMQRAADAERTDHVPFDGEDFGSALAHMALRDGVTWWDDHPRFELARVDFEITFDGDSIIWTGHAEPAFPNPEPVGGPTRVGEHSRFRKTLKGVERATAVIPRRHREWKAGVKRPAAGPIARVSAPPPKKRKR